MINVFSKIRKKLFSNKVGSYLLYAVGEIILVMIGILLALYVNNLNEERKLKNSINANLRTIAYDMEADTLSAKNIIQFYKTNIENSNKIIKGEITKDNYTDCIACLNLVTIYQPFTIQNKGFEQLKTLTELKGTKKDSLIADITRFYSVYTPLVEKNNNRMETIVMKNFSDFEKFPWFIDLAQNKLTDEIISYFTESDDYKKRVASHRMLATINNLTITQKYKDDATELIDRIYKRINKDE
ncbi:hypothetical protein [Winogradskyella sp.]|jgi:hypothetical protein|uniref:hypothetical protein n=1 Tax=Winogradskyella sp. TaxID=1883156 RepID=UPI0025FB2F3C|nr:hypothetical protein [Winogradskyella sp.]MCT4629018.1 hypothetical protein [Winogradskyella sp.]